MTADELATVAHRGRARTVKAAVAAGHPATLEAGVEILEAGGTAADAAVAASLASCVAETVMTGLLGGGFAIHYDAASRRTRNLDFFVSVPSGRGSELTMLAVPFGEELVHYAIGAASCAVHGVPAGLGALHREYGRLSWDEVVAPALRLARTGVAMPPAHASCLQMLATVMTLDAGARIYAPGGRLLAAGERLEQPGLVRALELLAEEGPSGCYSGSIADALLRLSAERGGLLTRADLAAYEPCWSDPVEVPYRGYRFLSRAGLSRVPATLATLPELRRLDVGERATALAAALDGRGSDGHTTNLVTADRDGNACALTTSLGLGSGDFVPELDLHLNSMLGEAELLRGELEPGSRMDSMMAPSLALDDDGVALAVGAAGGTRLRTALVGVVAGVLDEGVTLQEAVDRPRFHPIGRLLHVEPGLPDAALAALEHAGWEVRLWQTRHHYFGGASAVDRFAAAGDPRRSGAARVLDPA